MRQHFKTGLVKIKVMSAKEGFCMDLNLQLPYQWWDPELKKVQQDLNKQLIETNFETRQARTLY